MSNENTARRGLYLPQQLDNQLIKHADENNVKINYIILKAISEYMEKVNNPEVENKKLKEFVVKIIEEYNAGMRIT